LARLSDAFVTAFCVRQFRWRFARAEARAWLGTDSVSSSAVGGGEERDPGARSDIFVTLPPERSRANPQRREPTAKSRGIAAALERGASALSLGA
jgi:hypothetical protein